jgi:hypothetical protein
MPDPGCMLLRGKSKRNLLSEGPEGKSKSKVPEKVRFPARTAGHVARDTELTFTGAGVDEA